MTQPPDEEPPTADSGPLFGESSPRGDELPSRIGPYHIQHLIQESGMGAVYAAISEKEGLRQRVAIKVVRQAVSSEEVLKRFELEKHILGSLEHPNIARFLDAGRTDSGRGYFVMEYVQGLPIHHFCDVNNLSVRKRLELFAKVCSAVHYAHTNLVVHRDLKPGNILVTPSGEPKLLDFGIAKLLNPNLAKVEVVTGPLDILMTPEYAAPEQVMGAPVSTLSDVYSLGVLLYELLTGRRPLRLRTRVHEEVRRVICDTEPERPSTRLMHLARETIEEAENEEATARTLEDIARKRGTRPNHLVKQLSGELDDIVMMAMSKAPLGRYPSAEMLSQDLANFIGGEPVLARRRRRGLTYKLRKLARKHPAVFSAAAAAVLALAVGLSIALVQWQRAESARAAEATARAEAQTQRTIAEARTQTISSLANGFVEDLYEKIVPLAGSLEARHVVLQQAEDLYIAIEAQSADAPDLQADLADAYEFLGATHADIRSGSEGDLDKARQYQEKARDLRRALHTLEPSRIEWSDALAVSEVRLADLDRLQGRFDESLAAYHRAVDLYLPHDAPTRERLIQRAQLYSCLASIAGIQMERRQFAEARINIDRANELRRAGLGITQSPGVRRNVSIGLNDLGDWHALQDQHDLAIEQYRQAIEIQREIVNENPDSTRYRRNLTLSLTYLSKSLAALAQGDEALVAANEALAIIEGAIADHDKVSNQEDVRLLEARILARLCRGEALGVLARRDEARAAYSRALGEGQALVASAPGVVRYADLVSEARNGLESL